MPPTLGTRGAQDAARSGGEDTRRSVSRVSDDVRMALRATSDGALDDVVVQDVSMFRAEMLDEGRLWLACYLPNSGVDGDRVTFEVTAQDGRLAFEVVEMPEGSVSLEPPTT